MMKTILYSLSVCFMLGQPLRSEAQTANSVSAEATGDTTCLYVNLNKLHEQKLVELHHSVICFEYEDRYGTDNHLAMHFYDWQHQLIATVSLPKQYGKNAYSLSLQQLGIPFTNQIFTLETVNETGTKGVFVFKLIPPPDQPDPTVDIFVNPIVLKCNQPQGNLVEFYGTITGGKAPYEVEWAVLNANQSALLYQPRQMKVAKAGQTPVIQVEQSPGYMVQLRVLDACGKEGKQIVNVQCRENRENPNTLFWQPLPHVPGPQTLSK